MPDQKLPVGRQPGTGGETPIARREVWAVLADLWARPSMPAGPPGPMTRGSGVCLRTRIAGSGTPDGRGR